MLCFSYYGGIEEFTRTSVLFDKVMCFFSDCLTSWKQSYETSVKKAVQICRKILHLIICILGKVATPEISDEKDECD